jgi:hypothetical protein
MVLIHVEMSSACDNRGHPSVTYPRAHSVLSLNNEIIFISYEHTCYEARRCAISFSRSTNDITIIECTAAHYAFA